MYLVAFHSCQPCRLILAWRTRKVLSLDQFDVFADEIVRWNNKAVENANLCKQVLCCFYLGVDEFKCLTLYGLFTEKNIQDHAVKDSSLFNVTMACNWLWVLVRVFCHTVVHLFNPKKRLRYFEMMKSKKRHDRQSVCCFYGLNHRSIFNQPGLHSWRFFRSYATHGGRCIKLGWCTCTSVTWWKPGRGWP